MTTYREAAEVGFELLDRQYEAEAFSGNFWFAGNTLHTCLNYLVLAGKTDNSGIFERAVRLYKEMTAGDTDWWVDDYGWWGNAFVFAVTHREALGYAGQKYENFFAGIEAIAAECWVKIAANCRDDPYTRESDYAMADTEITGGVFNSVTQIGNAFVGRNSVTNEGFWLLSEGLARLSPNACIYSKAVQYQHNWFNKWLRMEGVPPARNGIFSAQGLVLERPTGNKGDGTWCWSGDQGLFSEALLLADNKNTYPEKIILSVIDNMTDESGVLHENMEPLLTKFKDFIGDYATGKGIMLRGVAGVNQVLASEAISDFIRKNASAVWRSRRDSQFVFNWNPSGASSEPDVIDKALTDKSDELCNVIMQSSGLDALNAALQFFPDENFLQ